MAISPDYQLLRRAADHAVRYRLETRSRERFQMRGYPQSLSTFAEDLPETGTPGDDVIDQLVAKAEPGLNAMTGPQFYAWVVGGSHPVGVAADILTSAWGQNTGNHHGTPSAAAAETVASTWLLDLLD